MKVFMSDLPAGVIRTLRVRVDRALCRKSLMHRFATEDLGSHWQRLFTANSGRRGGAEGTPRKREVRSSEDPL
eukprot:317669-Pyramimonas_sp.AAC.1